MHSKSMKMVFVASIIRHELCMIYAFFCLKIICDQQFFYCHILINLTIRGPFYTCLVFQGLLLFSYHFLLTKQQKDLEYIIVLLVQGSTSLLFFFSFPRLFSFYLDPQGMRQIAFLKRPKYVTQFAFYIEIASLQIMHKYFQPAQNL